MAGIFREHEDAIYEQIYAAWRYVPIDSRWVVSRMRGSANESQWNVEKTKYTVNVK